MPAIREVTVYAFDELSDRAKESARDWFRGCLEPDELTDLDDWQSVAEILGVEFDTSSVRLMGGGTRQEPRISWNLGYSQGDYASFTGRYSYAKGATKRIREYAPQDKALHRIADDLQGAQRAAFYRLEARATETHRGGMSVEVWDGRDEYRDLPDNGDTVRQALRDFASWIYDRIRAQNDYLTSDEAIDESILANEYEFDADGSRA
jgi:hypothetical protein